MTETMNFGASKEQIDLAGRYAKEILEGDLCIQVSAYIDFLRISMAAARLSCELDEAIEHYDYAEWLVGAGSSEVTELDICFGRASVLLVTVTEKALARIRAIILKFPETAQRTLWGGVVPDDDKFFELLEAYMVDSAELDNTYPMEEANLFFCDSVRAVLEKYPEAQLQS